jgi:hypothetical protein
MQERNYKICLSLYLSMTMEKEPTEEEIKAYLGDQLKFRELSPLDFDIDSVEAS